MSICIISIIIIHNLSLLLDKISEIIIFLYLNTYNSLARYSYIHVIYSCRILFLESP